MNNVMLTRVSVFRNVKDYKFVPKLESEKRVEIEHLLTEILAGQMEKVDITKADDATIKFMRNRALMPISNCQIMFLDRARSTAVFLFDEEHITIVSTGIGFNKTAYENAKFIENLIASKVSFAYRDDYGYLMSNVQNLGCGLRLECDMDLFGLESINKIDQLKQNVKNLRFVLKKTQPSIYAIVSTCNLGYSESEILAEFEKTISKIQDLEVEADKVSDLQNHDLLVDNALRSVALLKYAHKMDVGELRTLLKNIKVGLNLGILTLSQRAINSLTELAIYQEEISSISDAIALADKIKEIMKGE